MGREFLVDENVLIPRQDTELLAEEALKVLQPGMRVLDMCTGSGCILLSLLAEKPELYGVGADISDQALKTAEKNAHKMIREGILFPDQVQWIQSDLFEKVTGKYSVLVSNPPYIPTSVIEGLMPEVRDHEPRIALDGKEDGLHFYRKIVRNAEKFLEPGGRIFFEIGCEQGEAVSALLEQGKYTEIKISKDLAGLDRVVMAKFAGE